MFSCAIMSTAHEYPDEYIRGTIHTTIYITVLLYICVLLSPKMQIEACIYEIYPKLFNPCKFQMCHDNDR